MAARPRRMVAVVAAVATLAAAGAAAVSPAAPSGRQASTSRHVAVPILLYHHISGAPAGATHPRLWVSPGRFRRQLATLAQAGYRAVTIADVWRAWHGTGTLPDKPIVLSFDDGYPSQYRHAARIMRAYGWPGVLFLQVGRLDDARGLGRGQVEQMIADGWELGAHTRTHPNLTTLDATRLQDEVAGSREALRRDFGVAVDAFAYPNGRVDATVESAVRTAGFTAATTTQPRVASPGDDVYRLPRILVAGTRTPAGLLRLLRIRAATLQP